MQALTKGDVAEFLFDAAAIAKGLIVTRPIHAGTVYDRVVEGHRFMKVQIKTVSHPEYRKNGVPVYRIVLRRTRNGLYQQGDVDVFCILLKDIHQWLIIPFQDYKPAMRCSIEELSRYIDNWQIFETL